ncbi:MAG: 2-C-methyl-D-erythritol 4-phosphate cytidylyltransferase [Elusimicrobiales bacterium]|nr:2-C-methyl-D-erythritol 4-phosphate cytidylyltransferase [Elusimicrobiales bacterium]
MTDKPKTQVIIVAGGKSIRAKTDKLFFKIKDKHILEITVSKFINIPEIDKIILVLSKENKEKYYGLFNHSKIKITEGGDTRMLSLINGSKLIDKDVQVVMVHDGARPFVSENLIKKLIYYAYEKGCAVPGIKLKDTVKEIDENMRVVKTLNRENLVSVQTPQCYLREIFEKLIGNITDFNLTDDSQIIEKLNLPVYVVEGEETNLKITTPTDFKIAEVLYEKEN